LTDVIQVNRRLLIVTQKLADIVKFKTDYFSIDKKIDHYIAAYQAKIESLNAIMHNLAQPSDMDVDAMDVDAMDVEAMDVDPHDDLPLNESDQPLDFQNDQPQPGPSHYSQPTNNDSHNNPLTDEDEDDIFSRMEIDFDNAGSNDDVTVSCNSSLDESFLGFEEEEQIQDGNIVLAIQNAIISNHNDNVFSLSVQNPTLYMRNTQPLAQFMLQNEIRPTPRPTHSHLELAQGTTVNPHLINVAADGVITSKQYHDVMDPFTDMSNKKCKHFFPDYFCKS